MNSLLKQLCEIYAPSGDEVALRNFLIHYVQEHQDSWRVKPEMIYGDGFQDCLVLVFGEPRTAIFAHMDSIGYTVRYQDQLVPIGSPAGKEGQKLVGRDSLGPIECALHVDEHNQLFYRFPRGIDRGTNLVYAPDYQENDEYITSCYLDNRLGVYNALQVAPTLQNGVIAFSCWEEHGGGSVQYLARYLNEMHSITQALVSDITWVTDGVEHGGGVAISMRDRGIPRRQYLNRIIDIARHAGIDFQLEVESAGFSDAKDLQFSPYPFDWCFVGAPEANPHTSFETVHKHDVACMVQLYQKLMAEL